MRTITEIGRDVETQDNLCTALPIFAVQQKRRVYGFDPAFTDGDDIAWVDGDGVASAEKAARLEAAYQESGDEPDGWTRTGYVDSWEFVTCCFTESGCEAYIRLNGHNLKEPRIYVYSGYRNAEWETVRDHLIGVGKAGNG